MLNINPEHLDRLTIKIPSSRGIEIQKIPTEQNEEMFGDR